MLLPLPVPASSSAIPESTVRAFYDALARQDCVTAVRLRAGDYTLEECRRVTRVSPARVRLVHRVHDVAVVAVKVAYARGGPTQRFAGFVTLRREDGVWRIAGKSFVSRDRMPLAAYLRKFAPGASAGLATPTPPATVPNRRAGDILHACWSADELAGTHDDRTIASRTPPDVSPPELTAPASALASLPPEWRGSIRSVTLPPGKQSVALTFDLCERASERTGYDAGVVDALRRADVRATFFAGGKWMRSHPVRAMQLMSDRRFEIGNHAWTHGNLRVLAGQAMRDQILWTQGEYERLRQELAAKPCVRALGPDAMRDVPRLPRLFRFPYGTCRPEALDALATDGLAAIQWNVVSGDPARGQTAAVLTRSVVDHVTPGSIVIMHANGRGHATAKALPEIIRILRDRGYAFVTVSELLRAGDPVRAAECYENRPGDNLRYDRLFGTGTGE